MRGFLIVLIVIVALGGVVTWGSSQRERCAAVPSDGVIRKSGRYCVAAERVVRSSIGIDIDAPDVILDLRGGTLRTTVSDPRSMGVKVSERSKRTLIVGGVIDGFSMGVVYRSVSGFRMEGVTFRRIGAIAILSSGDDSRISGNTIEAVGGQPLEPTNAYAVAANLTGRGVVFARNTIRDVQRQHLPDSVVGEAVGVLIGDSCADCVIDGNQITTTGKDGGSIGIWNSGTGKVEIRRNRLSGFSQGIVALGRQFVLHSNQVNCVAGASSTGLVMSLGRTGAADGEGSAIGNKFQSCAIDQMICSNGCRVPWALETAQRLWMKPPG